MNQTTTITETAVKQSQVKSARPWDCILDVPLDAWIRNGQCDNCPSRIIGFDDSGVRILWHGNNASQCLPMHVSYRRLSEAWEWSFDMRNWNPCTK